MEYQINRLQRLQNCAARLITGDTRDVNSIIVLRKLHWLPIRARIRYKILLLTFKAIHNHGPQYMKNMLLIQVNVRNTRSSNNELRLAEQKSKLQYGGDRAFSVCAPKLWNRLPCSLRSSTNVESFKRQPKAHLFNEFLV